MKLVLSVLFVLSVVCSAAIADEPDRSSPTWSRDIAPILYRNCVECHQPKQVAPFSLLSYQDAAKRAEFIAKAVNARAMPPWLPDGPVGAFLAERRLTSDEIATVTRWAEAGAPAGELSAAPAPPPPDAQRWVLGQPDLIVRMNQPFNVPPGPADSYEVFPVPFSLDTVRPDVLAKARIPESEVVGVAAVEIHPGNARALHHADIWIDLTGTARQREAAEGGNGFSSFGTPGFPPAVYLGGRVPGMTPRFLPPGIATSVLPLKGDVVFQIHYRATGKPEIDQSEVGIFLMRQPVKRIMDSLMLRSLALDIPAGDPEFVVEDTLEIPADCILMNVLPHMHLIAREVHASLVKADGSTQPLLDISRWNFKWQDRYVYRDPILLKKGTKIQCRWVFDNSTANKRNPFSPPHPIQFGPNATDEMCSLLLGLIPVNLEDVPLFAALREKKLREKVAELTPEQRARHNWNEALDR
jgi:Copper type II ascorbate-dependent monooxygenase, C-terminal domain